MDDKRFLLPDFEKKKQSSITYHDKLLSTRGHTPIIAQFLVVWYLQRLTLHFPTTM